MWSASEESSGAMEGGPPEAAAHTKETCEQNKNQLESLKEIMMRNQQSLKKKEEEVQEYARRLSKIKSRAKLSRRSKEGVSSKDTVHPHKTESTAQETTDDAIDDISQAKTPKAKSSLLQRKLVENRKAFEKRSKELTETKRAVEEKVEAIRQQLDETDLAVTEMHKDQLVVTPIRPVMITSDVMAPIQAQDIQEKEQKIVELNSKIIELEAIILDLQENLKEKDSVIDSKTKAVTLMSADLSKKGKTTLDTLEDTKDEMRTMQENFVLIEASLKNKNASLLEQLQERDDRISELEHTVDRIEEQLKEQKMSESASVNFSRSTMDTLAETKDAMKSMQENFVLIESSLKLKNDNLLQQLEKYEIKLAEAKERIFQLESGAGIVTSPAVEDLQFKIEKLEQNNRQLLDEKYELQKNIAELQDKVIISKSAHNNDAIIEKDNRIAELENLIDELKQSNELLEEESKVELQKQVAELSSKNEEYSNKVIDLEKQIHELEAEKNDIAAILSAERAAPKEDDVVIKLTKELEDLNKSMIKLKAQHRSKVKNLQKQLENFKMVSDTNAELVRLGNQVALLEEEKGNLQLSLVDFDELKASAGDWQERIADLESKVASQTKEIQMHIDAIAILENQKLDLTQELHTVKQEVLALEAENAESENLRVTAEIKVVELEEQLETIHKEQNENKLEPLSESEYHEVLKKLEALTQENSELYNKLSKIEEKGTSDTGSTESFEAIQMNDRNDLLKKIEDLEQKNNELTLKLTKLEEKDGSHAGSTESFETINDTERSELLKKVEQLTQENSELTMKLNRIEEKGSSDTGSTESFERIPEHNDNITKIELLTQENNELAIKVTKLEEQLSQMESSVQPQVSKIDNLETLQEDNRLHIQTLTHANDNLVAEISNLNARIRDLVEENGSLHDRTRVLTAENTELVINRTKLEERLEAELSHTSQMSVQIIESADQINILKERQQILEKELAQLREASIEQSVNVTSCETDDAKSKIVTLEKENAQMKVTVTQLEEYISGQKEELTKIIREKDELNLKLERLACDDFSKERLELIEKLEKLNREKQSVVHEREELHEQISTLLQKSSDEISEMRKAEEAACQETQAVIVASLEKELESSKVLIAEYKNQVDEMNMKLQSMETELREKAKQLVELEASGAKLESLECELKDMFVTAEDWKFKYDDMQTKMQALEQGKASIEEAFKTLESNNKELLEAIREKDAASFTLREQLQSTIYSLEARLQDEITAKEREIADLKAEIEKKDQELHTKYAQLQNGMITIDNLQEELNNCSIKFKENEALLSSLSEEVTRLNDIIRTKEEEARILQSNISSITEALEQSKPLTEFNELLESLRNQERNYIELQNKCEEILRQNHELSQKIEDMSKGDEHVKNELTKKQQEIDSLLADRKELDAQLEEIKSDKTEAERRVWELQAILDNQTTYAEKVQSELTNEYKKMERLKDKHTEDIAMLNRRLEDVMEELVEKAQENVAMKAELNQKEELLGKNITDEMKVTLEDKVTDLEQKLSESENKLQVQSEKMKKIVATFNKKKAACQELEARVAELEEKWTTEKDEKEVKNKQIQEVENSMREKDNKIEDLEERLSQAKNDVAAALAESEKFAKESLSLKEKMAVLMEHNAEMGEEIEKQRAEIERISLEMAAERTAKEDIAKAYELYKEAISKENEQKQAVLDEVKEEARELSVRMQVMETEYVEQLATIKNLMAENGLLSSKKTQIDEKLENAEKESEERRVLIEQLRKEIANMTTMAVSVQNSEQNVGEDDDVRIAQHSEQCQNLVQALEARLQERQAEIENLNNELANSYGNIVLLHDESQRYNDMMMQTAQERFNQSLMDQTNTLQQEIVSLKTEKVASERRISELETELEEYKHKNADCRVEIPEAAETFIIGNQQQQQTGDDIPQLSGAAGTFALDADASNRKEIERLQSLLNEKQMQCSEHVKEIDLLLKSIEEERLYVQKLQEQIENTQDELEKRENLLSEKNAQVDSLRAELTKVTLERNELKVLQEQCDNTESERLLQLMNDKNAQIDFLTTELNAANQQVNEQLQQHADVETGLRTEVSLKDTEIAAVRTELISMKEALDALTMERDQQSRALESYKSQIANLAVETRNVNDSDLAREWEQRVSAITKERDLLQLQVNDLTRCLQELEESSASQRNIQIELENVLREKEAQIFEANQNLQESKTRESRDEELISTEKSATSQQELQAPLNVEELMLIQREHAQLAQAPVEEVRHEAQLDIGLGWDSDLPEKFNVEEPWGWSTEDVPLVSDPHLSTITLNAEVQLRARVEDLQDRIKDLEAQNARIAEESKAAQVKSGKLVKKLKEYKVQMESLQQQLKTQKQTDSFFDLDTAIEEELKTQIASLEKALGEIKEERKNIIAEKDALQKRFDVVASANERYMEMKERQDMEVEVLRIRNKELDNKVQSLEWRLQENAEEEGAENIASSSQHNDQIDPAPHEIDKSISHDQPQKRSVESTDDSEATSKKYKEEIDDLKDELEALAAENEQLQHFLEEQKAAMANLEPKRADNTGELMENLDILSNQNAQLQSALNKSKEEYDTLRKQYEQSLIDANDQVAAMRQNSDLLKIEFTEKVDGLEAEVENLQRALEEKKILEDKLNALMNSEEKLSTANASLTEVTELLNARVQEVADLRQELQVQYVERQQAEARLQSEMHNLTRELDEKAQELQALRQAFGDKEQELIQQRNVETVSAVVSEATQELVQKHAIEIERKDKELHDLTEKLTALQSAIDEYTLKLQDSASKLETQQQQIVYLKEDLTERNELIGAAQANVNSINEKLQEKQQELAQYEEERTRLVTERERYLADIQHLQSRLNATEATTVDAQEYGSRIRSLEQEVQFLKSERESILSQYDQETKTYQTHLENDKELIAALKHDLQEKTEQLHYTNTQLCAKESDLEGIKAMVNDKDSLLEITSQELNEKQAELEALRKELLQMTENIPIKTGNDDDAQLQNTIDELKAQMEIKQQELEHLRYVLSENTYSTIIQQMQDRINCLYNEKATLETSLQTATQILTEKQEQVNLLTQRINGQNQEYITKEEVNSLSRDRRSVHDQEEIVRLQNELHAKEQEINELKYIIAEKDSQLCLQASMEPQSDDFELRESIQRLTGALYGKEQEVQALKSTIAELQEEVLRLQDFERLSEENRNAIERLTSEKEQIRVEAEEYLHRELQSKESEIDEIKQRLSEQQQKLLAELRLKDTDIENLRTQLEQLQIITDERGSKLQQKENELMHTIDDLAEKERRLAELSITKDAELHNLKVQIREKEARMEELLALSVEEEKQLDDLRRTLMLSEIEVSRLKEILEQKISDYELLERTLKKDASVVEAVAPRTSETVQTVDDEKTVSSELDLALYMLHQRDVRCEELTHELMQLLEERDTLQLRLSNAIRVNEELRRVGSAEASPTKDSSSTSRAMVEPVVEQPSPVKSEGPVEIAKEAIDTPIEDKEALAMKLSQLHSISHAKDVRLKDERELRHTQQMSLLAHRDVLSTLPPEAAARLVNANYTLSRDVQSQSSVLLNWLWGKSTPKVVHM